MEREPATRDSWKRKPMPALRANLKIDRTFTHDEYEHTKLGIIPEVMEDRWFIYLENDWLYFHRSWTGYCIYQVRLELVGNLYKAVEAYVNRDVKQYLRTDDNYDRSVLMYLIDSLLLGKDLPFPTSNDL